MRYPMLSNWATITEHGNDWLTITNELTGRTYLADPITLAAVYHLDGKTDPESLPFPQLNPSGILAELRALGLIRNSMFFSKSFSAIYRTVYIPKKRQSSSVFLKVLNALLWFFFLPLFFYGLCAFILNIDSISLAGSGLGSVIAGLAAGYALGTVLHECAHVIAALAAGGSVFELGVSLNYLIFPGAYAVIKEKSTSSSIRKAQVSAAGIEANLIIAGIALAIVAHNLRDTGFLLAIALINILFVLDNILLLSGIDGCLIYSNILGLDTCITDAARNMLLVKEKRRKLLKSGSIGKASFCTYCIILLIQAAGVVFTCSALLNVIAVFL